MVSSKSQDELIDKNLRYLQANQEKLINRIATHT